MSVNVPVFDNASGSYGEDLAYARGYGLTYAPEVIPVDKSGLQDSVSEALKFDKSEYSAETWQMLEKAMENAKLVLNDENASEEDVSTALDALQAAMAALEKLPTPTPAPTPTPDGKNPDDGTTPDTGDTAPLAAYTFTAAAALAVFMLAGKKKEE